MGLRVPAANTPTREQLVDELGELDRKVTEFAPTAKRYKAVQDLIRSWYPDLPAEQEAVAEGRLYKVLISPRSEERKLSVKAMLAVFGKVKKARFVQMCSLTLQAVKDELGEAFLDEHVTKERTGSRKLVPVLKQSANQAA